MSESIFTVYQQTKKQILWTILGLVLVILSAVVLFIGNDRYMWIGVMGVLVFGLIELVLIRQLFAGERMLVLTPDGLYDYTHFANLQEIVIPWDAITAIELVEQQASYLQLTLDQTVLSVKLQRLLDQVTNAPEHCAIISLASAKYLSNQEIYEHVTQYWQTYRT